MVEYKMKSRLSWVFIHKTLKGQGQREHFILFTSCIFFIKKIKTTPFQIYNNNNSDNKRMVCCLVNY